MRSSERDQRIIRRMEQHQERRRMAHAITEFLAGRTFAGVEPEELTAALIMALADRSAIQIADEYRDPAGVLSEDESRRSRGYPTAILTADEAEEQAARLGAYTYTPPGTTGAAPATIGNPYQPATGAALAAIANPWQPAAAADLED